MWILCKLSYMRKRTFKLWKKNENFSCFVACFSTEYAFIYAHTHTHFYKGFQLNHFVHKQFDHGC